MDKQLSYKNLFTIISQRYSLDTSNSGVFHIDDSSFIDLRNTISILNSIF